MDQTTQALIQLNDAADLLQQAQKTLTEQGFLTDLQRAHLLKAASSLVTVVAQIAPRLLNVNTHPAAGEYV